MKKAILVLCLLWPSLLMAQSGASSIYLATVTQSGTGDLVIPLGMGGNAAYRINVYVSGGWAELSATYEVHKSWGNIDFQVTNSSNTYSDVNNRLRIHSKNNSVADSYVTLTWRNDSPGKAYENTVRVEIFRIGGINTSGLPYNWNTGATTAFTGFNDITDHGLITYANEGLTEIWGKLAINAEMPTGYKLAVGGAMVAESVKVKLQGNWPDYVFSKGHSLLSLGDLERYIQTNRHLPEVPSAEEVKKDGIELGEMNAKLLQKIEELTLYVIEMDKKMSSIQAENKELRKKLN